MDTATQIGVKAVRIIEDLFGQVFRDVTLEGTASADFSISSDRVFVA